MHAEVDLIGERKSCPLELIIRALLSIVGAPLHHCGLLESFSQVLLSDLKD